MAGADFRVLGPVAVQSDGSAVAMSGTKRRGLAALLIANRRRVVPTDAIADALWGEETTGNPTSSIHVAVSGLRKALRDAGVDPALLETQPNGYRLAIAEGACDLDRVNAAEKDGREKARRGAYAEASAAYARGLAEWRGRAYEELRGLRFADELAAAADEQQMSMLEARITADLGAGRHREVLAEIAALVQAHPLRETFRGHQMLALYRSGQQSSALDAFADLRRYLADELGIEPTPALRELHAAILRHDPKLDASIPPPGGLTVTVTATVSAAPAWLVDADGGVTALTSRLVIGRHAECGLVVTDPRASRRHAAVLRTPYGWVLTDLNSRNGTQVNGAFVESRALEPGDVIAIGDTELRLETTEPA